MSVCDYMTSFYVYEEITCKMAIIVKNAYLSADTSTFNFIMCIPEMKNEQHE